MNKNDFINTLLLNRILNTHEIKDYKPKECFLVMLFAVFVISLSIFSVYYFSISNIFLLLLKASSVIICLLFIAFFIYTVMEYQFLKTNIPLLKSNKIKFSVIKDLEDGKYKIPNFSIFIFNFDKIVLNDLTTKKEQQDLIDLFLKSGLEEEKIKTCFFNYLEEHDTTELKLEVKDLIDLFFILEKSLQDKNSDLNRNIKKTIIDNMIEDTKKRGE